jgi:hypothetical protein
MPASRRTPKPEAPAAPPADPLADLRAPEAPAGPPPEDETPEPEPERPTYGHDWHAASVAEVVAAWHADRTAQGVLHRGAVCACRHLARTALRAVHGDPQDAPEPEPGDDPGEPGGQ